MKIISIYLYHGFFYENYWNSFKAQKALESRLIGHETCNMTKAIDEEDIR